MMLKYRHIKRVLDLIFSLLMLLVVSPVMIIAAIAVMLESDGGALFRQKRPGKNGKIFTVYKFRTMRIETELDGESLNDMERMTKVGKLLRKTSIDELPQLINIIRGEMSFIGPRPLLVKYLQYYSVEEMRRHEVMPGISGWAQVNGRNSITWEEKFRLDVWYVDHMKFMLDVIIILKTIFNVFGRKGINSSDDDTMQQFTGTRNSIS